MKCLIYNGQTLVLPPVRQLIQSQLLEKGGDAGHPVFPTGPASGLPLNLLKAFHVLLESWVPYCSTELQLVSHKALVGSFPVLVGSTSQIPMNESQALMGLVHN